MSFFYWTVADGPDHSRMAATTIASARKVGVVEDFHVWSDRDVPGAICHKTGVFDHHHYTFKFSFLNDEVSKIKADFGVFLDADNYFVRHPGKEVFSKLLRDNKWFSQMECQTNSPLAVRRGDWWGIELKHFAPLLRSFGVKSNKIWNTNAGLFIVRQDAAKEFCEKTMEFYRYCHDELKLVNFTEEPALAYIGHLVDDPELNDFTHTARGLPTALWASDWTGHFKDRLPTGETWGAEDYFSGEKFHVNPAIVHAMRSKAALIKGLPK